MAAERRNQWGRSPMRNMELAESIDRIASMPSQERQRMTAAYRETILEPLRLGGVDPTVLERLKIQFLDPDRRPSFEEIRVHGNDDLSVIKVKIFDVFGSGILIRLDLSLGD